MKQVAVLDVGEGSGQRHLRLEDVETTPALLRVTVDSPFSAAQGASITLAAWRELNRKVEDHYGRPAPQGLGEREREFARRQAAGEIADSRAPRPGEPGYGG